MAATPNDHEILNELIVDGAAAAAATAGEIHATAPPAGEIHATGGDAAEMPLSTADRSTAILRQQAINTLTKVPEQLHTFVRCGGDDCPHGGVIPEGMMPLITCRGACVAKWAVKTTMNAPDISPAVGLFNQASVDGFVIRPGYRGGCTFCPDCVQGGKHMIASTKPGIPEQCIVCVGAYADEEAQIKPTGDKWSKKELTALGDTDLGGMLAFPLLSQPLAAWHLRQINDLAHQCKEASDALRSYELPESGNPPDENPGGDCRWLRRTYNITNDSLRELLDVLHERMRKECDMRTSLKQWVDANPARAGAACTQAGSTSARHENAVNNALFEGLEGLDDAPDPENASEAPDEDPQLSDLRQQLKVASDEVMLAKKSVEAKMAQLGAAKEQLDAAADRSCKKKAAAAGKVRPKAKTTGTSKSKPSGGSAGKSSGPKKTITKAAHEKVCKQLARQTYQSRTRHQALQRLNAIRLAEQDFILEIIADQPDLLKEFRELEEHAGNQYDADIRADPEHDTNPDDTEYNSNDEASDMEDED